MIAGAWYDLFVTGFYTAEYAAEDGSLRWEKYFGGTGNWKQIRLTPHCLAFGPNGMVAVSGSTAFGYTLDFDVTTIVYRQEGASEPIEDDAER